MKTLIQIAPKWAASIVALALLAGTAASCDTGGEDSGLSWQDGLPAREQTWEQFRDERTVVQADGSSRYFVADDLSTANIDDLRSYFDAYVQRVEDKSTGVKVSGAFVKWPKNLLSYCVASNANWGSASDSKPREYIRALMSKATAIWSRNVNIRWVENNTLGSNCETSEPTAGHVDFTVVSQGTSSDFGGNSFLPNWSVGSRQIHVNMGIFVLAYYATFVSTGEVMVGTDQSDVPFIAHELGHTCGLDHEHGHSGTYSPTPAVTGPDNSRCFDLQTGDADLTTQIDYCSLMTTGCKNNHAWQLANCPGLFLTITTPLDDYGMRRLYGPPAWWTLLWKVE